MVRLAVLAVLLLMTIWEWHKGPNKYLYWLALLGLGVFFSFRYGQGTDYLTYLSIYVTVKPLHMLPSYSAYTFNKIEIGFFYLMSFCRMLKITFPVFIGLVSCASLLLIDRFIRRYSPLPIFSIAFFYAVYSLTYMESGIRQLMTISLVLGFVLVDWARGRRWRAMIGVLLAATLHYSVLLLLTLPLFCRDERSRWPFDASGRRTLVWGGAVAAVALVINFVNLQPLIMALPARLTATLMHYYLLNKSFSPLALLNRTIFVVLTVGLAWRVREQLSVRERFLLKLYLIGFGIYLMFMSIDLIASRTNVYFRVIELALLPALLYRNRDLGARLSPVLAATLALIGFIYVKDMRAIMGFAEYHSRNVLEYPYITVFHPTELMDARFIPLSYEPYMNQAAYGQFDFDNYYRQVQRKPSLTSPVLPY